MPKAIKRCRICGKEYESCKTAINNPNGLFRWQEVACCPEHGAEYLALVLASRGETVSGSDTGNVNTSSKKVKKRSVKS